MDTALYEMIFRRKSFHLFRGVGDEQLTPEELDGIRTAFEGFERLYPDIRTAIRLVPTEQKPFKKDAEYCILLYSEKKENYLMNAGYIGQQMDLWLAQHGIGSLWYGLGKPDAPQYDGLDYVIMLAVRRVSDAGKFRRDLSRVKRKPVEAVCAGERLEAAETARFAPSACNSQPWQTEYRDGVLTVSRIKKPGRIGIMSPSAASYFNRIDMGIYLCVLELCLLHGGSRFERALFADPGGDAPRTVVARYRL